ncbi:MAG: hypothetical protein HY532_00600 [Chloroflexi bacterium]|nr:hypothetical protein [Chloroflexota bacterium]
MASPKTLKEVDERLWRESKKAAIDRGMAHWRWVMEAIEEKLKRGGRKSEMGAS